MKTLLTLTRATRRGGLRPYLATISLILVAPAILLVTSGLFYSVLGIPQLMDALDFELIVFRPVVLTGALLLAAGINLISLVRGRLEAGSIVGIVRVRGHLIQLGLLVLVGMLSSIIFVYLLAENLQIFAP